MSEISEKSVYQNTCVSPWPEVPSWLGRESALASARGSLSRSGVVILTGAPGIGKSWMAAKLGREHTEGWRNIWINCQHDAADLREVIWYIQHHLRSEKLGRFLESDRSNPYPNVICRGQIAGYLSQGKYVLCFDGLRHIEGQRDVEALVDKLADIASGRTTDLHLIITSRCPPSSLSRFGYQLLKELDRTVCYELFELYNVKLGDAQIQAIHQCLGGTLAYLDTIGRGISKGALLSEDENIYTEEEKLVERLLAHKPLLDVLLCTFRALSSQEKALLFAIAIFDAPITLNMLKAALVGEPIESVWDTWHHLKSQGLVLSVCKEVIDLPPLARGFYRKAIPIDTACRFHHNLAEHFARLGDIRQATEHYLDAGESQQAADFLLRYADYTQNPDNRILLANLINDRVLRWPAVRDLSPEIEEKLKTLSDKLQGLE